MIGRKKEFNFVRDGFSNSGNLRCAITLSPYGAGKSFFLDEVKSSLTSIEKNSLIIAPLSTNYTDLNSFLSSMVRNISLGSDLPTLEIGKFARFFGSKINQILEPFKTEINNSTHQQLADTFVQGLEETLIHCSVNLDQVIPVIILDDIDKLDDSLLEWLCGIFNQTIRDSLLFTKCRFLFSAEKITDRIEMFLAKFGFANPAQVPLPLFNAEQCIEFAQISGYEISDGEAYRLESGGNPLKMLNILKKPTTLTDIEEIVMSNTQKKDLPNFSDFSEKELNYLLFASYPSRINRYNLEFFCSPRDAAFCFNWLKRQKDLAQIQPDGDLLLSEDFRFQMREFHKQEEPIEAEKMATTGTIIDAFTAIFPDPNSHWIPINLQVFDSFTKSLCKKLFVETEYDEIVSFVENSDGVFNMSSKQFSLVDDVKLVTKRFIEIGGGAPKDDLVEKAKMEWEQYQEASVQKRTKLEQEKVNLEEEAFDAEKQILSLDELKKQLIESHNNPPRAKSKKEFSFSTSISLIVLGLATIGGSLFIESLGTYHAACGLALTLFGFFWPNVESKKEVMQTVGGSPRLAIETQQRSLTHRMNGLVSRVASIRSNLENLNADLEGLDQGMNSPYISE